ncbi:MAG: hypothetical protein F7B20_00850 [Aeropyrum sp.]|nr:hypothetical protein [Aeropyrum sp.]
MRLRADEEEVPLSNEALEKLSDIGSENSLRYALQLLEPSLMIARRRGSTKVEPFDVEEAQRLFADLKKSLDVTVKYKELML